MTSRAASDLRARAEALSAPFAPLLAAADSLARAVQLGEHGQRRAGQGDAFWQYRRAQPGDPAHRIDWRRSARADRLYVQEKEWQTAKTVQLWADGGASMGFASHPDLPRKSDRAALLITALSVLLLRAGERVGLSGDSQPAGQGRVVAERVAARLTAADPLPDLDAGLHKPHARHVIASDFLGPLDGVERYVTRAAAQGARGAIVQLLDPVEERFPFQGRVVFEDMTGQVEYDTREAADLRGRYLQRLAARKAKLQDIARRAGWRCLTHHTDAPALPALLWLTRAVGERA
ncbi:DUF58 domain-containing protein [Aliiroseovarius marinus]|uniref:DUF58 domain-containing protein n=1 Tax=Aliiroseovarius marinus TaxID=2500159 RepID=UPI003D7E2571